MIWKALALASVMINAFFIWATLTANRETLARLEQHERWAHRAHG